MLSESTPGRPGPQTRAPMPSSRHDGPLPPRDYREARETEGRGPSRSMRREPLDPAQRSCLAGATPPPPAEPYRATRARTRGHRYHHSATGPPRASPPTGPRASSWPALLARLPVLHHAPQSAAILNRGGPGRMIGLGRSAGHRGQMPPADCLRVADIIQPRIPPSFHAPAALPAPWRPLAHHPRASHHCPLPTASMCTHRYRAHVRPSYSPTPRR